MLSPRKLSPRKELGFTFVEMTIAAALMSMLFLGATTLYTEAFRSSIKAGAQISASQSSATGILHVEDEAREAYTLTLPENLATFGANLGSGYQPANFRATYTDPASGNTRTIDTGLLLTFPMTGSDSVYDSAGTPLSLPISPYVKSPGPTLYIYRADLPSNLGTATPATPDPLLGDCLWESGTVGSTLVNRCVARLSDSRKAGGGITSSNVIPNAVEFSSPSTLELSIRLISSYYSPISSAGSSLANQQGSEDNLNNNTQLTGKCVLLRNPSS
jgi:type II secretory pathway pseudopilin PulG